MKHAKKPLIVLAVTSPRSIGFLRGQITYLQKSGFNVAVVSSPGEADVEGASFYPVKMEREISPLKDLISLFRLIKLFLHLKPQIVNYGTPKVSLLAGIASFLTRVPCRVYTNHGLRFETTTGYKRRLLLTAEKITILCSQKVICVSQSLRKKLVKLNLVNEEKSLVIGSGSSNGIDVSRFRMNKTTNDKVSALKQQYSIPNNAKVMGFVGRITRDKGVTELIEAFNILKKRYAHLYLLACGMFEEGDAVSRHVRTQIEQDDRIIYTGFVTDIVPYFYLMDFLVLPTYREGFPNVLLEANACGKPVIASKVTGCVDAIVDGKSGLLVQVRDVKQLVEAIEYLVLNPDKAQEMGEYGKKRVERDFQPIQLWKGYARIYNELLREKNK